MLTESGITFSKCVLALGSTDLRRGIDGLSAAIRLKYGQNPLETDTLFLFCGKRKDRLKGLLWTGDRFVLIYIRLAEGRFQWPKTEAEARQISGKELMRLMNGFPIDSSIGPRRAPPPKITDRKAGRS